MGKRSRSESRPAWGMSVNRQITKVQCPWRRALGAEERMSLRLGVSVVLKRAFDIVCSAAGLVFLSPLLLWIAWRIKREDGGSGFLSWLASGVSWKARSHDMSFIGPRADEAIKPRNADNCFVVAIIGKKLSH